MDSLHANTYTNFRLNQKYYVIAILIFKIFIGLYFFSSPAENWYIPFMKDITISLFETYDNPFKYEVGKNIAFPYGYGLILTLIPGFFLSYLLNFDPVISYFVTLAITDFLIYFFIKKITNVEDLNIFIFYFCNPIIILSTYYLGLNDIIPVYFVIMTIYFVKNEKILFAAFCISVAASCKMSMILGLPLLIIYFHHNKQVKKYFWLFSISSVCFTLAFVVPHLLTEQAREMLFNNPNAIQTIFLQMGAIGNNEILLLPVLYSLLMLAIWHINRLNFDLLINLFTIIFISIAFFSNASPGWFVWGIVFLVCFVAELKIKDKILIFVFHGILFFNIIILGPLGLYDKHFFSENLTRFYFIKPYSDIINSIFFSVGILLIVRLWLVGILSNNYYKFWRKPLVIGVTGNSGVGKTTFAKNLENILGKEAITDIKGDSYHIWDRNKTIWKTITHLNPRANELSKLSFDVQKLVSGKSIKTSFYDHKIGKKFLDNYKNTNNFIIIEGLHVLSLPMMRNQCDIKIFLDIEESLRRDLKIERDTKQRGYKNEDVIRVIERRKSDEAKYIETQKQYADIIIKTIPTSNYSFNNSGERLIIELTSNQPLYFDILAKTLVHVCDLGIEISYGKQSKIIINGVPSKNQIEVAAKKLVINYEDILCISPQWSEGVRGIIQLLGILHISYSFEQRVV